MFAVVNIAGSQFKVSEKEMHYVPKLNADINSEITLDSVILYSDDNGTKIGQPFVSGVNVKAKVLDHLKDEKVIVFKKKRRISYRRLKGHRQQLSKIEILQIG